MTEAVGTRDADLASDQVARIAWIRRKAIEMSFRANSAHLGSSLSCVEILDSIISIANLTAQTAESPDRDRIILSKGHAAMGYYAALAAHGLLGVAHLDSYLADDTVLWGHVTATPSVPAIDGSTGSLGHGLGLACGYAYGYRLNAWPGRIFCVLSDGECNEGSLWEAALFAGHHRLNAVAAVVDYNKIQSLDRCEVVLGLEPFADKWLAFGWTVEEADGHDPEALNAALSGVPDGPRCVIAHTVKGKGIPRVEDTVASHYHPALSQDVDQG